MNYLTRITLAAGLLLAWPGIACAGLFDYDYYPAVKTHLNNLRCEEAVADLNKGLQKPTGLLNALAGHMYEQGSCVDKNWETAAQFYQRAHFMKEPSSLAKLVTIHAKSMRDPAAALWWAVQRPGMLPDACTPASPTANVQGFVEELRAWPAGKLPACVGVAEIVYGMWYNISFRWSIGRGYMAPFEATFNFGDGTVEWRDLHNKSVFVSRVDRATGEFNENERPGGANSLLWSAGVEAMQASRGIEGLNTTWRIDAKFEVERSFRPSGVPIFIGIQN